VPAPEPKAQPKRWAGLQPAVARAEPPVLPPAPAPNVIAPAPPDTVWATPPLAAGPRRVAFEGGVIAFFAGSIVITDKKHPRGITLPAHGVEYSCESKSQSCTIAAGETRIRVKHAADYKRLMEYLTQAR
jgi:hypothetical protein